MSPGGAGTRVSGERGGRSARLSRRDVLFLAAAVLPPVVLAAMGTMHPRFLTPADAGMWRDSHVLLLPVFPLLGLGPWVIARRADRIAGVVCAVLGYVYAVFYTALDLLAGIGAGSEQLAGHPEGVPVLFHLGDALAVPGTVALLVSTAVAVGAVLLRSSRRLRVVAPGLLLLAAAISFQHSHIFFPEGVLTMLAFALGWGLILWSDGLGADGARAATRPDRDRVARARTRT